MSAYTNLKYIQKYSPFKVTLYGVIFWLFLFVAFPLNVKYELGFLPVLYIIVNYIAFLVGLKVITEIKPLHRLSFSIDNKVLKKVLWIIIYIAFLGFILRAIDKFYIRGVSLAYSMSENRVLLEKSGPSIISILSAVLNPFGLLPIFIYYTSKLKSKWLLITAVFLFFSSSTEFLILGSRSGLFVLLVIFGMYLFYFKKLKITLGRVLILGAVLGALAIYSVNLFIERTNDFTEDRRVSVRHILTKANYNFTLEPKSSTRTDIINTNNETLQVVKLGLVNFAQYYLHGIYEFGYLYNNYEGNHHYGGYTFNIIAKFINIAFRTDINLTKIQNSPPRTGVYTTFFGPIYLDFAWFSVVFMFFFGVCQKLVYNQVLLGRIQFIPILFYFLILNFFMLVFNFINGAQGLYTITSFLLFVIIYIFLTGKLRISNKNGKQQYVRIFK